jgi:predicted MFS family arabinose efflux permease
LNRALTSWATVVALPAAGFIAGAAGIQPLGLGVAAIAVLAGSLGLWRQPGPDPPATPQPEPTTLSEVTNDRSR